ncbi:DNA polymerase III subunit epsilon [Nitrosomonadaceae bacterium]|nr:DNA polymerase III subunit epsilon [Nitrosomonadaceae bacterium]
MRQIFLDTETTGLEATLGHRIIEIAALEMLDRKLTGSYFHRYLNPGRESDIGALKIHGLTSAFLEDKEKFGDIAQELLEFIDGAELVIHNAPFDVNFLNHELGLIKLQSLNQYCHSITDTLNMAKELYPGKKNNLNALCERYQIDNSRRTLHGALLDAELLVDVYIAMTRGQENLLIETEILSSASHSVDNQNGLQLTLLKADIKELELHAQQLEMIQHESKNHCLWKRLENS